MSLAHAPWLRQPDATRLTLSLYLQPGAKTSGWAGCHGDALKLRLAAPPIDGRANAALIDFLAQQWGLSKRQITLQSGLSSRHKVIALDELSPADLQRVQQCLRALPT